MEKKMNKYHREVIDILMMLYSKDYADKKINEYIKEMKEDESC